jgi:hypothetical protein
MKYEVRSWVYFAQRPDGDIKIGTIVKWHFIQRMCALWREHGSIRVLGVIDGGKEKESELHGQFHEYRRHSIKMPHRRIYTEFFQSNDGLLKYIAENSVDLSQFKEYRGKRRIHDYFGFEAKT